MGKSNFISLDSLSFQDFDENSELIPLMTPEDEEKINNESLPESLPILPLRNTGGLFYAAGLAQFHPAKIVQQLERSSFFNVYRSFDQSLEFW